MITYEYVAGDHIERPATVSGQLTYRWHRGYHRVVNGRRMFPAVTRREAQAEARRDGGRARFITPTSEHV